MTKTRLRFCCDCVDDLQSKITCPIVLRTTTYRSDFLSEKNIQTLPNMFSVGGRVTADPQLLFSLFEL